MPTFDEALAAFDRGMFNPASNYPMLPGATVDCAGNPYGCNLLQEVHDQMCAAEQAA